MSSMAVLVAETADQRSARITLGLVILGILMLIWLGLVLNRRFASARHKTEIDEERARRQVGIVGGHSGSSGYSGHQDRTPGTSEDSMY